MNIEYFLSSVVQNRYEGIFCVYQCTVYVSKYNFSYKDIDIILLLQLVIHYLSVGEPGRLEELELLINVLINA